MLELFKMIFWGVLKGIGSTILNAAVFAKLWEWFICPLGLPVITYFHAAGIFLTVTVITFTAKQAEQDKNIRYAVYLGNAVVLPTILLVIGFIVKLLMG